MAEGADTDVYAFLDKHPFSRFQWMIFALCFVFVLLDDFHTSAVDYIAPSLVAEWGVSRPKLAPVLSAALFEPAAGALSSGPLADRFGRKAVLVGSVLIFGLACLSSAFSGSLFQLVVWHFVTGLGLGAAMPKAVTLMSEFCPSHRRGTLTNAMFCGFPLGAAFGGFLAAWMILAFGWRSVLILSGVTPLLLVVLLPDSVRYMVAASQPTERVRAALCRTAPAAGQVASFTLAESACEEGRHRSCAVACRSHRFGQPLVRAFHKPRDRRRPDQLDAAAVPR